MLGREYVVSGFTLIFLVFFCWPIFALGYGLVSGAAANLPWMKIAAAMTDSEIANLLHSLILPLLGAVIVFRSDDILSFAGSMLLLVMGAAIIIGFVVFAMTNPAILGNAPSFKLYVTEYGEVHRSILSMTSMLILLFLTQLGLKPETPLRNQLRTGGQTGGGVPKDPLVPGPIEPTV
jgi:hypothetical protein